MKRSVQCGFADFGVPKAQLWSNLGRRDRSGIMDDMLDIPKGRRTVPVFRLCLVMGLTALTLLYAF